MKYILSAVAATAIIANAGIASAKPMHRHSVGWVPTGTTTATLVHATDLGPVSSSMPLRVVVALQGNLSAANLAIGHMYTKGDPMYHHFLTPAQFAAQFGASQAQAQAVANYLSSEGMSNVTVSRNRLLVSASTTAGTAESAFDTVLHNFKQNGKTIYLNVAPAMVPVSLSGDVQSVLGLNNVQLQTSNRRAPRWAITKAFHGKTAPKQTFKQAEQEAQAGQPPPLCNNISFVTGVNLPVTPPSSPLPFCYPASFTPNWYRIAYDDQNDPVATNTIASDFTEGAVGGTGGLSTVVQDLYDMEAWQGIPESPVNVVQVGAVGTDTSGQDEWDIDSQAAVGIAGGVRAYYFYNGTDLSQASLALMVSQFASDDIAQLGNASFGGCEWAFATVGGGLATYDLLFAETVLQGQTITVSTGDTGSQCAFEVGENGVPAGTPGLEYPASSPYVLAVGGTSLLANSANGSYYDEVTWYSAGGGISYFEPQSPWQQDLVGYSLGGITAGNRVTPDVAMAADPYTGLDVIISGQQTPGWGGTSLAAPLAEGVYARIQSHHGNTWGNAGPALYNAYIANGGFLEGTGVDSPSNPPAPALIGGFNDIYAGTNTLYTAAPGFDLTTGMGSLDINQTFVEFGS